ncbi:MAG: glycoside hydrolase family 5 protein, partial [Verrucomicrobiota bacterium]
MTRVLALLLFAVCCQAGDVFEQARRLGRGVNMGNSLEAPKGATWGRAFGPEDFDRIRAAGFDSVRIPVRWADHAGKEAPFAIDAVFMEKVDGLVRSALERKLAVVLNVHHYEALDADPAGQRPRFVALWKQIGERFKDAPDELHFELSNEPHGAHTAELWNANLAAALAEVRRLHPKRAGPKVFHHARVSVLMLSLRCQRFVDSQTSRPPGPTSTLLVCRLSFSCVFALFSCSSCWQWV